MPPVRLRTRADIEEDAKRGAMARVVPEVRASHEAAPTERRRHPRMELGELTIAIPADLGKIPAREAAENLTELGKAGTTACELAEHALAVSRRIAQAMGGEGRNCQKSAKSPRGSETRKTRNAEVSACATRAPRA